MSKFDKARDNVLEKKFATYTLKISQPLFTKFKIKSLTDKDATYRETLTKLIEEYVQT
jgi:hypothetical protein